MKTVEQQPDTEEVKAFMDNVGWPWPTVAAAPKTAPVVEMETVATPVPKKPPALEAVGCL